MNKDDTTPPRRPATRYTGWFRRPRGRWTPLVQAADEGSCFRQLLDSVEGGDLLVLPSTEDPNRRRPGRG